LIAIRSRPIRLFRLVFLSALSARLRELCVLFAPCPAALPLLPQRLPPQIRPGAHPPRPLRPRNPADLRRPPPHSQGRFPHRHRPRPTLRPPLYRDPQGHPPPALRGPLPPHPLLPLRARGLRRQPHLQIGRASCRER